MTERRGGRRANAGPKTIASTKATTTIRVRVTAQTLSDLSAIAALNKVTLSAFIREAVEEAVADCSDRRVFLTGPARRPDRVH